MQLKNDEKFIELYFIKTMCLITGLFKLILFVNSNFN